ncbi:uncharacterized protein LOC115231204 [Argonauta hians]
MVVSWPDAMEDVDYQAKNFTQDVVSLYHPLWVTQGHYIYHLLKDHTGKLCCQTDKEGEPLCSPRFLSQLSIMKLVCDPSRMRRMKCGDIPCDVFPALLSEALLQKELISIEYLVSNWPQPVLDIQSLMGLEDYLRPGYLTHVLGEGNGNMCLLDCLMMGLINLKSTSPLREVNFLGFKNDKKLCRELARLPILWMEPKKRRVHFIHGIVSKIIDISPDRVRRFLNRISSIYSNMDPYIRHGNKIGPIKIRINCKVTLDDVPIGLALQKVSPFRFDCTRVWMESIAEIYLPLRNIPLLINPKCITHLEVEDPNLCGDVFKLTDFLDGVCLLPNLDVLSLPNTLHVNMCPESPYMLNHVLRLLPNLRKLHLPSCNLRDSLDVILAGLLRPDCQRKMHRSNGIENEQQQQQQQQQQQSHHHHHQHQHQQSHHHHHHNQNHSSSHSPSPSPSSTSSTSSSSSSFESLNLRDCRLSEADVASLEQWERGCELMELNLSRNNLRTAPPPMLIEGAAVGLIPLPPLDDVGPPEPDPEAGPHDQRAQAAMHDPEHADEAGGPSQPFPSRPPPPPQQAGAAAAGMAQGPAAPFPAPPEPLECVERLLQRATHLTCFSVSYCCIGPGAITRIANRCADYNLPLKTFAAQTFTPMPLADACTVLAGCARMRNLQACTLSPEAYAFPGADDAARAESRKVFVDACRQHLTRLGRPDIEVE